MLGIISHNGDANPSQKQDHFTPFRTKRQMKTDTGKAVKNLEPSHTGVET